MQKVLNFLFSPKLSLLLLLVFAFAIGTATFIEEKYDTNTAKLLIYNARWLEIVLLILVLNFLGNIKKYNLFHKEKLPLLLIHLALILMIIGAGITRFTGIEGNMHIREGQAADSFFTSDPYLQLAVTENDQTYTYDKIFFISKFFKPSFFKRLETREKTKITVELKQHIKNAVEHIKENTAGGKTIIEISVATENGSQTLFIEDGETKEMGKTAISFNDTTRKESIQVLEKDGKLLLVSTDTIIRTIMHQNTKEISAEDSLNSNSVEFKENYIYNTRGSVFLFVKLYHHASRELQAGSEENKGPDALVLDVSVNGKKQEIKIFGGAGFLPQFRTLTVDSVQLDLAYGDKEISLPFSLYLNDFILERYAGSMSPSSFASEVTLRDKRNNKEEKHRIFMNNVLDYDGYRFFQSSYDRDEKGTILSVNHDYWGTWISYLAYFMLGLGFLFSLLSKKSRFYLLRQHIHEIRARRKAGIAAIILVLVSAGFAFGQNEVQKPVRKEHAAKFGRLLVQTYDGRFEPLHTLSIDVMHKISRKDQFDFPGKGKMDASQVFLDILLDPAYWKQQKIIYIRDKSVAAVIGIDGKYASFYDFVDQQSNYKLSSFAETAFRKKQAEQNIFDKEIIKVDERINILMSLINGSLLKIFPEPGSKNNKWLNLNDSLAYAPLPDNIASVVAEMNLNPPNYSNILRSYLMNTYQGSQSGDYSTANKILENINFIQRQMTPASLLPGKKMISLEIFYNNSKIFSVLKKWYGLLSLVLLTLAFVENLRPKKSRTISLFLSIFIALLAVAFLYHTAGMGLRWYLSGHAPWSNGYETLILIAWGGLLAGFSFLRYSKITLAATALLAFSILMTAGHSSYDPQLTNLQPVLKSYWLIIHVAVITISYGFLALGFILGIINLFIFLFKNAKNAARLDLIGSELTYINEMNLTIGIVLVTIGTFLGGVWANESWGRYWGWDAKETWALIIIITYAVILHLRLVPSLNSRFALNVGSILGLGSVMMTFVGVNYYLSKGLHSYAADDKAVFSLWAWVMILLVILLILVSGIKEYKWNKQLKQ